jgi:hypothetical protein
MSLCPVHRDATPRQKQITAFLDVERARELSAKARAVCDAEGCLYVFQSEKCVRCGEINPFDLDDIPF